MHLKQATAIINDNKTDLSVVVDKLDLYLQDHLPSFVEGGVQIIVAADKIENPAERADYLLSVSKELKEPINQFQKAIDGLPFDASEEAQEKVLQKLDSKMKKWEKTMTIIGMEEVYTLFGGESSYSGGSVVSEEEPPSPRNSMVSGDFKIYTLEDFSVSLRDPAGTKTLQMDISVEVNDKAFEKLAANEAAIKDAIVLLISDYTEENLNGLDGKLGLKDDIQLRIDNLISPFEVERIYFTKFHYN